MVCGFHEYKEAEKQDVKHSAYLRDPFYSPAIPGIPPRLHILQMAVPGLSTHLLLPGSLCSSVNFLSIHFQMTFLIWALLNMHKIERHRCVCG